MQIDYARAVTDILALLPKGETLVEVRLATGATVRLTGFMPPYVPDVQMGMLDVIVTSIGPLSAGELGMAGPQRDEPYVTKTWRAFRKGDGWELGLVEARNEAGLSL